MTEQEQIYNDIENDSTDSLDSPVVAQAHTPIYTMHRYFARRPHNVFSSIIEHYSKPGDIILDPFMGGGVTVVESLRARRKVIGVDINPIAKFITKNEVKPVKLYDLEAAFTQIEGMIKGEINKLYEIKCANCGDNAVIDWVFWTSVVVCPNSNCGAILDTESTKIKVQGKRRQFICPSCKQQFEPIDCKKIGEKILKLSCSCASCGKAQVRSATQDDIDRYEALSNRFDELVKKREIEFPQDTIPDGDRVRDDALYRKGYTHFYQLFTKRNLLANYLLKKSIKEASFPSDIDESMTFVFSSSLTWSCRMRKDIGHGWEHHAYWIPESYYESNVWSMFKKQFNGGMHSYVKGKEYSNAEIGNFARFSNSFSDLKNGKATTMLLCKSSHDLPLPDKSIDIVITDPPFGGNVQYAELTDFWAVWIKENLGITGIIDNEFEAIQTRNTGFVGEKSLEHYEEMLFKIFTECHRVLKQNGWLVLTFHNRELAVWMALQRAASRAGFKLPSEAEDPNRGMIYQPPIQHYVTTMHQRVTGAMLGDFILSYKRQEIPLTNFTTGELSTVEENSFLEKAAELIRFHGGADDSTLMTGLIPYLNENNLFGKLANMDFRPLFSKSFVWDKKEKKWVTTDMVDPITTKLKPLDYVPAEQITEKIIYSFLKGKKYAGLDEILSVVYGKLVNSHRPGIPAINGVLKKLCDEVPMPGTNKRRGYRLKETDSASTTARIPFITKQKSLFGELVIADSLTHDQIIMLLYSYAQNAGYDVHIGETEQRKNQEFRKISRKIISAQEFGIPDNVISTIAEIDLILLKGSSITHAFEVATTVETANKAINDRYRNLHVTTPNLLVKSYVVVRDKDFKKAFDQLYSTVNVSDGTSKKIKITRLSQLTEEGFNKLL